MATIRDIAERVGVSTASVSRVLNSDPTFSIADETRERIISVTEELGYQSRRARRARKQNSETFRILVVIHADRQREWNDPYFLSIRNGVEKECTALGIGVTYHWITAGTTVADRLHHYDGIDGTIVIGELDDSTNQELTTLNPNIVFVDFCLDAERFTSIQVDWSAATIKTLDYFQAMGLERIAYLGGTRKHGIDPRERAFISYMKQQDVFDETLVGRGDWSITGGYHALQEVIQRNKPLPQAFFVASDPMALGALRALLDAGYAVPKDVRIMGCDGIEQAKYSTPSLSTIEVDTNQMGRCAVKMLVRTISEKCTPVQIYFPGYIARRESTSEVSGLSP